MIEPWRKPDAGRMPGFWEAIEEPFQARIRNWAMFELIILQRANVP